MIHTGYKLLTFKTILRCVNTDGCDYPLEIGRDYFIVAVYIDEHNSAYVDARDLETGECYDGILALRFKRVPKRP